MPGEAKRQLKKYMKNKTVKMILSVAVLLICCGAYMGVKTYVAKQEESSTETEENTTVSVVSLNTDEIKSLQFVIDKEETVFAKENDSWTKEGEPEFPVNQSTMDSAASAVAAVDSDRVIEDVEDIAQYGLDNPSNTIQITYQGSEDKSENTTVLRVGDKNDSTSQYYVSKDDDRKTVYLVDASCVEPFANSLYDYAEEEAFPAVSNTEYVSRIEVSGQENAYTLEKETDTGFWNISVDGEAEKADSAKASALATNLGSIAYDKFVDYDCENESDYGLNKPYAVITVDYQEEVEAEEEPAETEDVSDESAEVEDMSEEGASDETAEADTTDTSDTEEDSEEAETVLEDRQLEIVVGDEAEDDSRYVMVNGSNQVYTISNDTLTSFIGQTAADFWDMTVSYLSVNNLESMNVSYQDNVYQIDVSRETSENEDGEEETTTTYLMDEKELDTTEFTAFYNKLINMAGQRRLTEAYSPEESPEMTVTLEQTDGEPIEVEYYSYDTNYYAAVTDGKVYLVNKMTVKEMFTAFETMQTEDDVSEK